MLPVVLQITKSYRCHTTFIRGHSIFPRIWRRDKWYPLRSRNIRLMISVWTVEINYINQDVCGWSSLMCTRYFARTTNHAVLIPDSKGRLMELAWFPACHGVLDRHYWSSTWADGTSLWSKDASDGSLDWRPPVKCSEKNQNTIHDDVIKWKHISRELYWVHH